VSEAGIRLEKLLISGSKLKKVGASELNIRCSRRYRPLRPGTSLGHHYHDRVNPIEQAQLTVQATKYNGVRISLSYQAQDACNVHMPGGETWIADRI
jgi:hypothetical protein